MTRPDSIRAIGLKKHLDDKAAAHKNKNYADLIEMLDNRASQNYIARAFGVTKNTVSKWLLIHHEELTGRR
jgi:DNA invertase Pin-like site-specific DNA recombinase